MNTPSTPPYKAHLQTSDDLFTSPEATRAGFVALALEKNRRATPFIQEARTLQALASVAQKPGDLLNNKGIEQGLLTAAGLSGKSQKHLWEEDKKEAIKGLIENFLEPAGAKFVEELVFRFLLVRGDTLGGSMRNMGGALAQQKLIRTILSVLTLAGTIYRWKRSGSRKWLARSNSDVDIEMSLGGLSWNNSNGPRTLLFNQNIPYGNKNNVDLCLFNRLPEKVDRSERETYIALGELKGGIDPAGADEHWKTASSALNRIRNTFSDLQVSPPLFFIGAAIQKNMADEIWKQLEAGDLSNAANLNREDQVVSICSWLCNL